MFEPPKLGLEEEALRPRHQLLMELIGFDRMQNWRALDGWTALRRRGFSAKLRENVANFPAMEPGATWCRVWDSPRTIIEAE